MNDEEVTERFTDVLQNIEFAIHAVYRREPELTDYEVGRALEAVIRRYKDEVRGRTPRERQLTGLVQEVHDAAVEMSEFRLGRKPPAEGGLHLSRGNSASKTCWPACNASTNPSASGPDRAGGRAI